jgi:hypothetical protein
MIDADPAYHFDADPDPASWYLAEMWIRIQSDPGLIDQVSRYGPGSESPLKRKIFCFRLGSGTAC